jgi:hypothetical protein
MAVVKSIFERDIETIYETMNLDLTPDENGTASVEFDGGVICTLETLPDDDFIYFHSDVGGVPADNRADYFAQMLSLNLFNMPTPHIWMAFEEERGQMMVCGALPVSSATVERLQLTFAALVEVVSELRLALVVQRNDEAFGVPVQNSDGRFDPQSHKFSAPIRG